MKSIQTLFLIFLSSGIAIGQSALLGNAKSIVLTPPLEMQYTLGGYGARMNKPAEAIHDDVKAKALVINDDNKKYVIVTLDVVGLPPNVKPLVVEQLKGTGWNENNILLLPSHSHSSLEMLAINDKNIFENAAIGIFQKELLDFVVDKISNLIRETDMDLKPISVGTKQIKLEGVNRNRRGDESVDQELTVTRIDLENGDPLAVLVNWTAHPTIMDEHDMWVSGGWPGYLQRELESWIGKDIVAMYYNGAEGNQSVIAEPHSSHYEKAEYYGRKMAKQSLSLYEEIAPNPNPVFRYDLQKIDLPPLKAHPNFMQTGGTEYQLNEAQIQGLLQQIFPTYTFIPVLQLGGLMIVGAPGELFAEIGLDIKSQLKRKGVPYPVIGGLANEWVSYIMPEEEYNQGGYEASMSFYGPNLGAVIQQSMIRTAQNIQHQ